MKTYILTLSQTFQKGHPRAGEPTDFYGKFMRGVYDDPCCGVDPPKIHTIRGNYDLWVGRIKEVQDGEAVLSIRQWSGKPYNSKQQTLATLTPADGVGVQKVTFDRDQFNSMRIDGTVIPDLRVIAGNDGLTFEDFRDWFKGYDLSQPMAIIHFKDFRY